MSNYRAQISGPWIGTGLFLQDAKRPQLSDDLELLNMSDVTGQPSENLQPDPNLYTVEVVVLDTVLDDIQSDNTYYIHWNEEVVNAP